MAKEKYWHQFIVSVRSSPLSGSNYGVPIGHYTHRAFSRQRCSSSMLSQPPVASILSPKTFVMPFFRNLAAEAKPRTLYEYFDSLLKAEHIEPNASQVLLVTKLQTLSDEIHNSIQTDGFKTFSDVEETSRPITPTAPSISEKEPKTSWGSLWKRLATPKSSPIKESASKDPESHLMSRRQRGLYIWGGVGQGKTMLMDVFFDTLEFEQKRRVHFHRFMLDIHKRLHKVKSSKAVKDPLLEVARQISEECKVLCFDEFQVTHIDDAMILRRLFEGLFMRGTVVVATSNVPPKDLYKNGLNRDQFIPFIQLLINQCEVFYIDTKKDFRLAKGSGISFRMYHVPSREEEEVIKNIQYLSDGEIPVPQPLAISLNRTITVPFGVKGIAMFSWKCLCDSTIGSIDYISIADAYHTVFIYDIPGLQKMELMPSAVLRFIQVIDILYERHVRVIFDVAFPLFQLFGHSETIDAFEALRKSLVTHFDHVEDAFTKLREHSDGAATLSKDQFVRGISELTKLDELTLSDVFESLVKLSEPSVTFKTIRSALYYHQKHYDFIPPKLDDPFLFGGVGEDAVDLVDSAVAYKIKSEMSTVSTVDIGFTYHRTLSRMAEMTSFPYLDTHQELFKLNDLRYLGIEKNL